MYLGSSFDRAYFQTRLDRNRMLAARSQNPSIRDLHLEYVRLYEQLLHQEETAHALA